MTQQPQLRWVAPPSWPQPPKGWWPPEGWQPDPAWGQPPPGWQFWQPTTSEATTDSAPQAMPLPSPPAVVPWQPDAARAAAKNSADRSRRLGIGLLVAAVFCLLWANIVSNQATTIDEDNAFAIANAARSQAACPAPETVEEAIKVRRCDIEQAEALNALEEGTTRSDALRTRASLLNFAAAASAVTGVFLLWRASKLKRQTRKSGGPLGPPDL